MLKSASHFAGNREQVKRKEKKKKERKGGDPHPTKAYHKWFGGKGTGLLTHPNKNLPIGEGGETIIT